MALNSTEEALVRQLLDQQAAILSLAGAESTIISKLGATKVTLADLVAASSVADSDLFLVRQGTTEKSLTGAILKTISTPPDASTTAKGIVELATNAETQTGTDTVRAVTPASLQSKTASETAIGLVELATDAEAQAFTANKFIDGAKLATALKGANQSLAENGYQKLPGGLIIQWGKSSAVSGNSSVTVTLPISVPTSALSATASVNGLNTNTSASIVSIGNSQIVIYNDDQAGAAGTPSIYYIILGY